MFYDIIIHILLVNIGTKITHFFCQKYTIISVLYLGLLEWFFKYEISERRH